jgi:hypothetical protein
MALGPVQVLVVGFDEDAQFTGAALKELERLREHDVVRLIDLLFVHKNADGSVEKIELSDSDELAKLGAVAGALIGFAAAGDEGLEAGHRGARTSLGDPAARRHRRRRRRGSGRRVAPSAGYRRAGHRGGAVATPVRVGSTKIGSRGSSRVGGGRAARARKRKEATPCLTPA